MRGYAYCAKNDGILYEVNSTECFASSRLVNLNVLWFVWIIVNEPFYTMCPAQGTLFFSKYFQFQESVDVNILHRFHAMIMIVHIE